MEYPEVWVEVFLSMEMVRESREKRRRRKRENIIYKQAGAILNTLLILAFDIEQLPK